MACVVAQHLQIAFVFAFQVGFVLFFASIFGMVLRTENCSWTLSCCFKRVRLVGEPNTLYRRTTYIHFEMNALTTFAPGVWTLLQREWRVCIGWPATLHLIISTTAASDKVALSRHICLSLATLPESIEARIPRSLENWFAHGGADTLSLPRWKAD